jgi:RNA polymerase sigma-70 factor (ECF subfamily)
MRTPVLNESILLSRISKGDKAAFSMIFAAYYTDFVMFAFTFVKEKDISEEITQDVFVKLWDNRESLDIKTSLKAFLLKSVQNKCIDWLRHKKIKNRYSENVLNYPVIHENQTENYVLHSELERMIDEILRELPIRLPIPTSSTVLKDIRTMR